MTKIIETNKSCDLELPSLLKEEIVYLRKVDQGTDNECWVVCAKNDPLAVAFVPYWPY